MKQLLLSGFVKVPTDVLSEEDMETGAFEEVLCMRPDEFEYDPLMNDVNQIAVFEVDFAFVY